MLPGAGAEPKFPMPVGEFFEQHAQRLLKRGDIVLSRSPTPASRLIRALSGSFFSHAAMVFFLHNDEKGLNNTVVIESLFKGVALASLDNYLKGRKPVEEVGILRLKEEGFDPDFFRLARGIMLNALNQPYDYHRLFRIALSVLFGFSTGYARVRRKVRAYKAWMPRQFICSGFIQFGYREAAFKRGIPVQSVVMKNGLINPNDEELLATTPEDIANSDKMQWLFVIRRGWVHRVGSFDEAKKAIR